MCYRAKQAGFKVWYYPKTTTIHYKGQSSRKAPKRALYAFHDAMWIFYRKHLYNKYNPLFSGLVYVGIWGRYYLKLMQNLFRKEKIVSK
jgi:GT2 family glycosyltransferase